MEEKVLKTIHEYNLIANNENIVVGVSGGKDSMALLYMLLYVKKHIKDFNIIVAHVNHGVREEALHDQLFVKKKAEELGLKFYSTDVDMIDYANKHKISPEEAGRELRYEFFRSVLTELNGGKIALAHNINDQAETLMMRIIRGTGIDGLNGMEFINGDIIRPLLNVTRKEIEEYIEHRSIESVLDKTNLMPIYTRNKIRLELIPYIEENFNPNFIAALWRLSQTSRDDSNFLQRYTENKYGDILVDENKEKIVLSLEKFKKLDKSIQNRIVIYAIMRIIGIFQGISEEHISNVVNLFNLGKTGKIVVLPDGIVAKVDYNKLIIEKFRTNIIKPFIHELKIGYNQFDDLGCCLKIKRIAIEDIDYENKLSNIKYFDCDKIKGSLFLRNRRDGDRFIPLGMQGSKKIKDFFIDLKIPRDNRDLIPLVVDEESIIYVVGYRINELYKLTKKTKNVLMIEYILLNKEEI